MCEPDLLIMEFYRFHKIYWKSLLSSVAAEIFWQYLNAIVSESANATWILKSAYLSSKYLPSLRIAFIKSFTSGIVWI